MRSRSSSALFRVLLPPAPKVRCRHHYPLILEILRGGHMLKYFSASCQNISSLMSGGVYFRMQPDLPAGAASGGYGSRHEHQKAGRV